MAELSQVNLSDGVNSFVQAQFPIGTDVTGWTIEVYDAQGTIVGTLNVSDAFATFNDSGCTYYSIDTSALDVGENANGTRAVSLVDPNGDPISVFLWGKGINASDSFSEGSLAGETSQSLIDSGIVVGDEVCLVDTPTTDSSVVISKDGEEITCPADTNALAVCFLEGTLILTTDGETPVEALREGELLVTADGRTVPVKWMGRQTLSARFGTPERLLPVRIRASALADNVPCRDLVVTSDHGILVDGVMAQAGSLVNGVTIERVPMSEMPEIFTCWHIETDAHEVVVAEGAPAETFIDNVSRQAFDNYTEFEHRWPNPTEMVELPYLRVSGRRQLPRKLADRLDARAAAAAREGLAEAV